MLKVLPGAPKRYGGIVAASQKYQLDRSFVATWFDVDTGADLMRLAVDVCNGRATGYHAAHTRALLESFTLEFAESA